MNKEIKHCFYTAFGEAATQNWLCRTPKTSGKSITNTSGQEGPPISRALHSRTPSFTVE